MRPWSRSKRFWHGHSINAGGPDKTAGDTFKTAIHDFEGEQIYSLRIDGVATSIRIKNHFRETLTEIGPGDGMTVAQLITRLWHEAVDVDHDLGNFTSFLRICCNRYHALIAAGEISAEHSVAIASHPAREILAREPALIRG
ncbi:ribbon-helix-helix domain-containing protein [Pseudogemmobacter hezensis]|uniref:ribbon-helix-helix domain-containing protein n=1 Tax=Pseudogemmobacter hezensis TaxID=2737662 RepID=UPI0015534C63|nr:ribbon-helix-helix domain-containing protein [Pseudogemmobacter hezensis]